MTNAIAFDTHAFVKRMKEVGMPEEQAEVLAQSQVELIEERVATKRDLEELEASLKRDLKEIEAASKRDMKELEVSLKRDMKELETSLRHDMKGLEASMEKLEMRMTLKMGSMLAVAVIVLAALTKFL